MNEDINVPRPGVLDGVTETQIQELEQQFDEQDREAWNRLTDSYGWSQEESDAVWNWFTMKPSEES